MFHCLSHNNKTFNLLLSAKIGKVDRSNAAKNFFTVDGNYRSFANRQPKHEYLLEYHLNKVQNENTKAQIIQIIEKNTALKDTSIVYSKVRICFKTNFKYMTLEIFPNRIHVQIKNKNGWETFSIKPDDNLGRIKKALHRIHGLSKKPRLTLF